MPRFPSIDDQGRFVGDAFDRLNEQYTSPTDIANSSFLVKDPVVALGGDSITVGAGSSNASVNSYRAYLGKLVGGARGRVVAHAVAGESAAGLLARMPSILDSNPGALVVMIGTNPSADLATYRQDLTSILNMARGARIPTVLCTIPATGSTRPEAATHLARTNIYNMFVRELAGKRALPLADVFRATVDETTGYLKASFNADGTHPTPAGHLAIAQEVAAKLDAILPAPRATVTAPGAPGLLQNPLMTGGDAATTAPEWWRLGAVGGGVEEVTSTAAPIAGDGLTAGSWLRLSMDGTNATGWGTLVRQAAFTSVPAAGDVLLITAQVKTDAATAGEAAIQLSDGTTVRSIVGEQFGIPNPGALRATYTVPAGGFTGTPYIRLTLSAGPGMARVAYFGQVQVYNLTQTGLLSLV